MGTFYNNTAIFDLTIFKYLKARLFKMNALVNPCGMFEWRCSCFFFIPAKKSFFHVSVAKLLTLFLYLNFFHGIESQCNM